MIFARLRLLKLRKSKPFIALREQPAKIFNTYVQSLSGIVEIPTPEWAKSFEIASTGPLYAAFNESFDATTFTAGSITTMPRGFYIGGAYENQRLNLPRNTKLILCNPNNSSIRASVMFYN